MIGRLRMTRDAWALLVVAAGALIIRVWLPFERIFLDDFVNFQGDAWYHMRVIDNLIDNYPHRLTVDPYAITNAQYVGVAPLFDLVIATIALALGLGHPSAALVEAVGAFFPAVLGTVAVVLVFLIGRRLFDSRAALLAAALLAVMPGHFLDRTMLGVTDHHAAEVALVLLTLLLMTMTLQAPADSRTTRVTPWLTGLSLGAYFLTWTSAPGFAAGLSLWLGVQFLAEQFSGRSTRRLSRLVLPATATALAMVLAFQDPQMFRYNLQLAALVGMLAFAALLDGLDMLGSRWRLGRVAVAGIPIALAVAAVAAVVVLAPTLTDAVREDVARLQLASARTVLETQSLLFLFGQFSLLHPWTVFGPAFYLAVPALGALGWRAFRRGDATDMLLFVWSGVAFAATLGQNRFGYYLAPMLAVLAGWSASSLLAWARRETREAQRRSDIAAVLIAIVIFYPSLRPGIESARRGEGIPVHWREALTWLRRHTPEPFPSPGFYRARYDRSQLPSADYSVMAWWDYGYWIMRVAQRVPVSNPTQAQAWVPAMFLTATDEAAARTILEDDRSRYVIVDRELILSPTPLATTLQGKFESIVDWAGLPPRQYMEPMIRRDRDGRLSPVWVFYPDYYRSMAMRLMQLGIGAIEPANTTWVVTYADRRDVNGRLVRMLVGARQFASYAAADAHLRALGPGTHRIAGLDPFKSPVPLPALSGFHLIHESGARPGTSGAVRIYEVR